MVISFALHAFDIVDKALLGSAAFQARGLNVRILQARVWAARNTAGGAVGERLSTWF